MNFLVFDVRHLKLYKPVVDVNSVPRVNHFGQTGKTNRDALVIALDSVRLQDKRLTTHQFQRFLG